MNVFRNYNGFKAMDLLPSDGKHEHDLWTFDYLNANEALISDSMVQYVVQGSD